MRTKFTLLFAFFVFVLFAASSIQAGDIMPQFNPDSLEVMTKFGPVKGGAFGDGSLKSPAVYAWIKIPYAAPPLGDLMFRAPQDPAPWKEIIDGTQYKITVDDYPTQWDWGKKYFSGKNQVIGTADCLYLNVWRPQTTEANLPVQMDVHGGSSVNWAGLDSNEWQAYVNAANCIVVAPNYRLGPWGNFAHPALETGDPLDDSGNFALLDQIKALKWIKDNIHAFGGNPDNVTLSGQSSGGMQVAMLMHSPLAKDLFHKAITSSPSLKYAKATKKMGNEAAAKIVVNLILYNDNGITTAEAAEQKAASMNKEETAAYLRKTFTDNPLLVFTAVNNGTPHRPSKSDLYYWGFLDGYVVNSTIDWDAKKNFYAKPMIVGNTETDRDIYSTNEASGAEALYNYTYEILYGKENIYKTYTDAVTALVPFNKTTPGGWQNHSVVDFLAKFKIISDSKQIPFDIAAVQTTARGVAAAGFPVYAYRQDWASLAKPELDLTVFDGYYQHTAGADHSSDLFAMYDWNDIKGPGWFEGWTRSFVFVDGNYKGRKSMTKAIQSYFKAFLHSAEGKIEKSSDMDVAWTPWTREQEGFITWNASAEKAIIEMNHSTYTNESLLEALSQCIDQLASATAEDKAAMKEYVINEIPKYTMD